MVRCTNMGILSTTKPFSGTLRTQVTHHSIKGDITVVEVDHQL